MRYILTLGLLILFFLGGQAQKFDSASKGYFSDEAIVVVMTEDSVKAEYTFNKEFSNEEYPEVFYLLDKDGEQITLEPSEILYLEISRGVEPENEEFVSEEEAKESEDEFEIINVNLTTNKSNRIIYERVSIDPNQGVPQKGVRKDKYLLLQLVSQGLGDEMKIYLSPNFEEDGTEVAPMGRTTDILARNRTDYNEVEEAYYVARKDELAFRITHETYLEFAPLTFEKSRGFRRKYGIKRGLEKERTKKRKKTSRKDVGNKKVKASPLRYDEFAQHVKEYNEIYEVELVELMKKKAEREAQRAANRKGN